MSHWFNYQASLKILIFGLLLGSGLPALFAVAVRVGSAGAGVQGSDGAAVAHKNPALTAISYAMYALALARSSSACCTSPASSSARTPVCTFSEPSPRSIRIYSVLRLTDRPAGEVDTL